MAIAGMTAGSAARESQVQTAVNDLSNIIGSLEETAEALTQRLCQMLTPCAPSDMANKTPSVPTPVIAPHADILHNQVARLRKLNATLQDLHSRYEG